MLVDTRELNLVERPLGEDVAVIRAESGIPGGADISPVGVRDEDLDSEVLQKCPGVDGPRTAAHEEHALRFGTRDPQESGEYRRHDAIHADRAHDDKEDQRYEALRLPSSHFGQLQGED